METRSPSVTMPEAASRLNGSVPRRISSSATTCAKSSESSPRSWVSECSRRVAESSGRCCLATSRTTCETTSVTDASLNMDLLRRRSCGPNLPLVLCRRYLDDQGRDRVDAVEVFLPELRHGEGDAARVFERGDEIDDRDRVQRLECAGRIDVTQIGRGLPDDLDEVHSCAPLASL